MWFSSGTAPAGAGERFGTGLSSPAGSVSEGEADVGALREDLREDRSGNPDVLDASGSAPSLASGGSPAFSSGAFFVLRTV